MVTSFLTTDPARAAGPVHGAKAGGMGTAFVAVADDPSAIAANPAGLSRVKGTNIYGGGTIVVMGTSYDAPTGGREDTKFQLFFPPSMFASTDWGTSNLVTGIGIYCPFGIGGRKWNESELTRYAATNTSIATLNVNPVLAWKVLPFWSVGGGFYYLYATNKAERMIDQSAFGVADAKTSIDADGDGWGFNIGTLVDINDQFSLGLAYRSRSRVRFSGTLKISAIAPPLQTAFGGANFETRTETSMTFPDIISFGVAYRPTSGLTVGVDAELLRWSVVGREAAHLSTQVPAAGLTDTTTVFDWKDSWQVKVGADYRLSDAWSLRGGYAYIESQIPDATLSPAAPEADQHNVSAGLGYRTGNWTIDSFYMIGIGLDRTVSNDILSGTYQTTSHYIGLSIGQRF